QCRRDLLPECLVRRDGNDSPCVHPMEIVAHRHEDGAFMALIEVLACCKRLSETDLRGSCMVPSSMVRAVVLVAALGSSAAATPVMTFSADPHPGIHRETWADSAVPWRARIITIDLTSAEIAVYATKESERGLTTSAYATKLAAQVAINGDAFDVAGF